MTQEMNRERFFALISDLPQGDRPEIHDAYQLSKDAHRVQQRKGGGRYFEHPRRVATALIEDGFRTKSIIIKALLHDIVEDAYYSPEFIVRLFGAEMWQGLFRLSKKIPVFDPISGALIGRYEKKESVYYQELAEGSVEEQVVKVYDRDDNLDTMDEADWDQKKQKRYARSTRRFIQPMAQLHCPTKARKLEATIQRVLAA